LDGLRVLRRIREHERTQLLPVVILTSSNEERDIISGYNLGANSYVRKLWTSIDSAKPRGSWELYWLVLNEAPPIPARAGR
jgi:PleD family two-component response regulator